MRKYLLLFLTLMTIGASGVWAIDIKLATYNQPVDKLVSPSGSGTSTTLTSLDFSGLAGLTITAPNTDVTLGYETTGDAATKGAGYVNDNYGYCLSIVTPDVNSHTVKLTAPSGYKIIGYSLLARSSEGAANHVLTPSEGGSAITSSTCSDQADAGVWMKVRGILTTETSFTIQTSNKGNKLYIPRFMVSLVADSKKVKEKQMTGSAVAFSDIDYIADGETPVLLFCTGTRSTYVFDNPYSNQLGSCSDLKTSTTKFLIKKSGETYTIQNYDSKRYMPAWIQDGVTSTVAKLPSAAATFTIVDNGDGTYGIKNGTHSFNGNAAGNDGFCYWGSGTTGNSAYKIMRIDTEEDIEYTIPDEFFNSAKYYRIKAAGRGNYYLSASGSDTYIHLTTDAFDHTSAQVWQTPLASQGVALYSVGLQQYVAFNANVSAQGHTLNEFTSSDDAAYNFVPEDKGDGNYALLTMAPIRTYLSNNGGVSTTKSMGYYQSYDAGAQLQFQRVYRFAFETDNGTFMKYAYSDGNFASSELDDYDFSINGVAKTNDEVVSAINALTSDDALTVVCSHKRGAAISTKAEIDPTKVYSITSKNGRWMYANSAVKAAFSSLSSRIQTYNEKNQWAFVTVNDGSDYYLYNVGEKRFVMSRMGGSNYMDSKFSMRPVIINECGQDASYPIILQDGEWYFNDNGTGNLVIDTWTTVDGGNQLSIQEIQDIDFSPTEAQELIKAMSSNIPFVVSPAPSAGEFDQSTYWYNISMRPGDGSGGYYAYVPGGYSDSNNIPLNSTKGSKEATDNYRWCITGSATTGFRLFNKAAGADKVFVFDNGGKIKDYSGSNVSASLFYLAQDKSKNGIGSPTFVFAGTDNRPNRQSNSIASWGDSDTGSEFGFIFDVDFTDNNFYETLYKESVKPYMDAEICTNYFYLPSDAAKTAVWNAPTRYSDGVEHTYYSYDDVTAMRTTLETRLKKPSVIDVLRLKNNKTGKYVSYGTPISQGSEKDKGLICNESLAEGKEDLTSVLQFIPADASTYYIYMPTKGQYVGSQTSGNTAFPLVDEASRAQFTLTPTNTPGVITIYNAASYVNSNYEGYLHSAGWDCPGVVNWQAVSDQSKWNIEDAGTITLDMIEPDNVGSGEDVYMSYANNLGLPIKAPEDASVYIITSQTAETAHTEEVDSKEIPSGNGVILKAEKGSTLNMEIKTSTTETLNGNILVAGDGSTTVTAGNYMLAYNSTDVIAQFYAIGDGGFVVPANKAYLPAMGGGVKALVLSFDTTTGITAIDKGQQTGDSAIFNLAGQRLNTLQRGVNIVGGKKVVIR